MFKKFALCACLGAGLFDVGSAMLSEDEEELCFEGEHGKTDFANLSACRINQATSITLKNMLLDDKISEKFQQLDGNSARSLTLEGCRLNNHSFIDILQKEMVLYSIKVVGCQISVQDVQDILHMAYPYTLECVDFSDNEDIIKNIAEFNRVIKDFELAFPLYEVKP